MTQTLTTDELRQIVESDHVQCGDAAAMARELLANREAQPVAVTDEMALAFHRALNDGGIGEADLEEIKVGLNGALCNVTAPPAPAVQKDVEAVVGLLESGEWAEHCTNTELGQRLESAVTALMTNAPPAPAVPDESDPRDAFEFVFPMPKYVIRCGAGYAVTAYSAWGAHDFKERWVGWNACRAAMLAQPVSQGYKLVPVEPTPKQWAAGVKVMDTGMDKVTLVYKAMLAAAPEGGNG